VTTEYGCKVCRVLGERELDHYDDRLLAEWRGESGPRKGYRALARWLNVTLLRREMDKAGLLTLGDEAESKYDRLTGDDTSATEIASMLDREGIDIDALRSDFVSYGVIRTHITECLGAEYEPEESSDWEREAIDIAREHSTGKIRDAVRSLRRKGDLLGGENVSVHIDAKIECESCQTRLPLWRALQRGRICNCDQTAETPGDD
jgi:hypothetical protein